MPVATLPPPKIKRRRPVSTRLLTAADVADLPDELNGKAVRYELFDGELVIMAPPGGEHGLKQKSVMRFLFALEEQGLGVCYPNVGVKLGEGPDTVVEPDSMFILKRSLPVKYSTEGYLTTIPEIVIEVRSKNDRRGMIGLKNQKYLNAGVLEIWRLEPKTKTLILTTTVSDTTLTANDTLFTPLLPGFAVPVVKLFE
jgi:Uma2 family endonuclease